MRLSSSNFWASATSLHLGWHAHRGNGSAGKSNHTTTSPETCADCLQIVLGASDGVIHSRISHEVVSLRATANNERTVRMEEISLLTKHAGLCQSLHKTCRRVPWNQTKLVLLLLSAMILGPRHRNHHNVHFITHQSFAFYSRLP